MCKIIYEFPDYKLMLCPVEKNITANSTTNNTTNSINNTTNSINNTTNTANNTTSANNKANNTGSNLTNTVHTPSPSFVSPSPSFVSPSPSFVSPSPSYSKGSTLSHCHCDCSSPSVLPSPAPTPLNFTDVSTPPDLNWLHVFWCLPFFLIVYLCYKRHCCSNIQVGIARRRYEMQMRSKSWPRRVREQHPAVTKRSKSENFDTIVL
jgi:hypothetical protein